ncbi:NAD+ synthase [Pyrobaculum neutrophilum]|uniref:NH(3)-dependent NAD(+) synthetase n=1 Tax=Pyrobaculum neutrophilum (strain DSM 2338 / JCM 9278 / NBRC 100436 / V24Sta) TaxID=444157 RepID=B1YB70_PYRNV|nr:NAD+ synthase [Pyrobaculum neutrophilum]ACB39201.1 NAD+ synthetase [Pyrobaculum neutrophilum V24Sta]
MAPFDLQTVINALDYQRAREIISSFVRSYVEGAGARGVVVGLSGGVDSTVTAALAVEALGPERVLGLFMPSRHTPPEDAADVAEVAKALGIRLITVDITPIVESFAKALPGYSESERVAVGNIMARVRMTILYYYANRDNLLVAGSGDRSELLLGYFTKYGDGGVDILPIGSLYKVQVREMARRLGFRRIAEKPSSPRLWQGHTAEGELGAPYEVLDVVLYAIYDRKMPLEEAKRAFGSVVDLVVARARANAHKLRPPPSPDLSQARRDV